MSSRRRNDEQSEQDYELPAAPQRQNRTRNASTRLRTNSRNKVKGTKNKSKRGKVGGIHQRANKRMSW